MNRIANEIEGYIFYDIDTDKFVTDLPYLICDFFRIKQHFSHI